MASIQKILSKVKHSPGLWSMVSQAYALGIQNGRKQALRQACYGGKVPINTGLGFDYSNSTTIRHD